MQRTIQTAAVIGAGVMGAAIAAHLANVGIRTLLLDIVPTTLTEEEAARGLTLEDAAVRNRFALRGLKNAQKNMAFYDNDYSRYITIGNTTDDLKKLSEVDWIIEAVVENLDVKRQLFAQVEAVWRPGTIVSTNTSGVSIHQMTEGRSDEFQRHFLGTHFFNPPRFMKLLEIIPHEKTDPELLQFMIRFAEDVLGKGVVLAKDTPNFIANRIGTYGMMTVLHLMLENGLGPEEVDALTGPVMGRPKSATFRTVDLVGIDTFVHVAENVRDNVADPAEKHVFEVPGFIKEMVKKGSMAEGPARVLQEGKDRARHRVPGAGRAQPRIPAAAPAAVGLAGGGQSGPRLEAAVAGAAERQGRGGPLCLGDDEAGVAVHRQQVAGNRRRHRRRGQRHEVGLQLGAGPL